MSNPVTGPAIWPAIKALFPDIPEGTTALDLRIRQDEVVSARVAFHPYVGGDPKLTPDGRAYEVVTERFALIPYGATRPSEEREEFIAELIQCLRWAAAVTAYEAPTPGELEEVSTRARALIAKHEGRS